MWKRTLEKKSVAISRTLFTGLKPAEERAFNMVANQYGRFIGMPFLLRPED
jgi:hypothetical protein